MSRLIVQEKFVSAVKVALVLRWIADEKSLKPEETTIIIGFLRDGHILIRSGRISESLLPFGLLTETRLILSAEEEMPKMIDVLLKKENFSVVECFGNPD